MTKRRPFGITVLAILVGLGALVALYHTLQFFGLLPYSLGPLRFFGVNVFGGLLWAVNTAILLWVAVSLWNLRMEGRLFVLVIAVVNLCLAFLSIIGQSSFAALLPAILINVIILIYCLSPGVTAAFEEANSPAGAGTGATASAAPVAAQAASVPAAAAAAAPVVVAAAAVPEETPAEEAPVEAEVASRLEAQAAAVPAVAAAAAVPEEAAAVPSPAPAHRPKVLVETIEGIGPVYAARLKAIGINFVSDLLEVGSSRKGREDLADKTGISGALILKWVNMADLMRISGVGEEYSELLEAAGVDTVKELRNRNPENLHKAMLEANEQRKLVRRTPHLTEVQSWVAQAKQLPPVMTY